MKDRIPLAYERDPYLQELQTDVVSVMPVDGRVGVVTTDGHTDLFVCEGSVAVIPIESVGLRRESLGATVNVHPAINTVSSRVSSTVERDVVDDVDVQVAIAIIVGESSEGTPSVSPDTRS